MPSLYAINTVHVSGQEKYLIVSQGEEGIAVASGSGEGWTVFLPRLLQHHPSTPGLGCGCGDTSAVCVLA